MLIVRAQTAILIGNGFQFNYQLKQIKQQTLRVGRASRAGFEHCILVNKLLTIYLRIICSLALRNV